MKNFRNTILVSYLFLKCLPIYGQNLINDPGFEDYLVLPCELGSNQMYIGELLRFWNQPTPSSSDYWSLLADTECVLNPVTPSAVLGEPRIPRNGDGMGGVITYFYLPEFEENPELQVNYREYFQTQLSKKLEPGNLYQTTVFVSSDRTDALISNNLGVYFSEKEIKYSSNDVFPEPLPFTPQVNMDEIALGNEVWTKINGCFSVNSSKEYMIIGNFFDDNSTTTKIINPLKNNSGDVAYYFIDDVSVEKLPYSISRLAKKKTFCFDEDTILLNAFIPGVIEYQWEDGSKDAVFEVTKRMNKSYNVDITFPECTYNHTFEVIYTPDIYLGEDTVLCNGESLVLNPKYSAGSYQWYDASFDSIKVIDQPGEYWAQVQSGCIVSDTISIGFVDCPNLVPNVFTPNGDAYNQFFEIENIKSKRWQLTIYNRSGKIVYYSDDYENNWSGDGLEGGMYYYHLFSGELDKNLMGWVRILK
ncbi:MAG: gliding motility-associated C-terminal domain-containing protein [Cyclobacteriaceae bacterium]